MLHSGYSPMGHDADADALDGGHWTPFMNAAANGHLKIVRSLLECGVRINAEPYDGYTSLRKASYFIYVEIVALLLQHGADIGARADIEAENKDGRTPLHLVSPSGQAETVHMLLHRGANANAKDKNGWIPLHQASFNGTAFVLLDYAENKDERTPLHLALSLTGVEITRLLLDVAQTQFSRTRIDGRGGANTRLKTMVLYLHAHHDLSTSV